MRIFLLRLLIASWLIPLLILLGWPIAYLIMGSKEATEILKELLNELWFGI